MTFQFITASQLEELGEGSYTRDQYDELKRDAEGFQRIDTTSPSQLSNYMVTHQYTETKNAAEVGDDERKWFMEEQAPRLREFKAMGSPGFEQWHEKAIAKRVRAVRQLPIKDRILSLLGPLDLVFIGLGLWTAVKVGHGAGG